VILWEGCFCVSAPSMRAITTGLFSAAGGSIRSYTSRDYIELLPALPAAPRAGQGEEQNPDASVASPLRRRAPSINIAHRHFSCCSISMLFLSCSSGGKRTLCARSL